MTRLNLHFICTCDIQASDEQVQVINAMRSGLIVNANALGLVAW